MRVYVIFFRSMLEATTASIVEAALRWIRFRYQNGRLHLLMLVLERPPYLVAVYDGKAAPSYLEGIPFTTIPDGRIVTGMPSFSIEALVLWIDLFLTIFAFVVVILQPGPLLFLKIVWQMMVNLTSRYSNAHKLEGHTFSRNEVDDWERIGGNFVHFAEGELLTFLKPEEAADRAIAVGNKFSNLAPSLCLVMIETFHRGVALYIMARKTKKRKYKSHASKIRKTIKKWLRAGNPNVEHYSLLLDAEHAALGRAFASAEKLYAEAIVLASRMEYLHHAALFNERYADFLLNERKDPERASYYLDEAIRLYEQWGATRKIKMLQSDLDRSLAFQME